MNYPAYPEFAGKVALISGAGDGIGRATALAFARSGARLVVSDLHEGPAQETAELIVAGGGEAVFRPGDVSVDAHHNEMVRFAVSTYGGLDYAFNNTGFAASQAPVPETDQLQVDRLLDLNLKRVWSALRHQIPAMIDRGGGAIVNNATLDGLPNAFSAICSACTAGVVAMSRAAAIDHAASNVRVNSICRAVEAGEDAAHGAQPDQIAESVLFLCSETASYVVAAPLLLDRASTLY